MKRIGLSLSTLISLGFVLAYFSGPKVLSQRQSQERYSVRIHNVDDVATVYVNGKELSRITYRNTDYQDITNILRPGKNQIRLVAENYSESFTYGFEISRGGETIFSFECGKLNERGCGDDFRTGIVWEKTVTIDLPTPSMTVVVSNTMTISNGPISNTYFDANLPTLRKRAPDTETLRAGAVPSITQKIISENDARQKIAISVRYPQISAVASASDFNALSEQLARHHIAKFKGALDPPDADARNRELNINYKAGLIDNRLVSIDFGAGTDWGGVHPNSYSFVLNYDLGAGRELALNDLFSSNSGYLKTISEFCIRRLRNQVSDYGSLRDGAAPSLENYDSWVITKSGLSITFDAYQVASYADGPKTCVVPYNTIRRLIADRGPISHLVK